MILTRNKAFDNAKQGINKGIYKTVRLIRKSDDEPDLVLVHYSKINGEEALKRLEYIRQKVDRDLPSGIYEIQCKINFQKSGLVDSFPFEIKERQTLQLTTKEPETLEAEIMNNHIDFDDYVKLIKEVEGLKAQNALLQVERDYYKKLSEQPKEAISLNDEQPKTLADKAFATLETALPPLVGLAEKFFELRERQIALAENKTMPRNSNTMNRTRRPKQIDELEEKIVYFEGLYDNNPDQFNDELDNLEIENPELYSVICDRLGLDDSEEE